MILELPIRPDKHLAQINYEQAEQHYQQVLKQFTATSPRAAWWFRVAQERREMARELLLEVLCG